MFFASLQHKLIKSETLDPSGKGDAEVLFMTVFSTRPLTTPRLLDNRVEGGLTHCFSRRSWRSNGFTWR